MPAGSVEPAGMRFILSFVALRPDMLWIHAEHLHHIEIRAVGQILDRDDLPAVGIKVEPSGLIGFPNKMRALCAAGNLLEFGGKNARHQVVGDACEMVVCKRDGFSGLFAVFWLGAQEHKGWPIAPPICALVGGIHTEGDCLQRLPCGGACHERGVAVPPAEGVHRAGEEDIAIPQGGELKAVNPAAGFIRQAFLISGQGNLFSCNMGFAEKILLELLDFLPAIR